MKTLNTKYVDLKGREWSLRALDPAERKLIATLQEHDQACRISGSEPAQKWCAFDNLWLPLVVSFYTARGLSRKEITQTPGYQIAQDLSGRMAIALGVARQPDYRSGLCEIIDAHFKTRREFCEATGLAEDMLSHVLAGRKDLSMESLSNALDRIGYTIRFVPSQGGQTTKSA